MAYILNKTDGTALVTVEDNSTTGTNYSVKFIGKNYLSYGEDLNESLLHLLENSASVSADRPAKPVIGQTWYNKTDGNLYVCYQEAVGVTAARFKALAKSNFGTTTPTNPVAGDIWFDLTNSLLKIYIDSTTGWLTIGPSIANWTQATSTAPDYIKNKPTAFAAALTVKDEGIDVNVVNSVTVPPKIINFTGAGVTATLASGTTDSIIVDIPGGGNSLPANSTGYLYNSGNGTLSWVSLTPSTALASLSDVDTTGVAAGNVLKYTTVGGVSKWRPSTSMAASTSFTLATTNGAAKSMGVVLTPGTWQVILDTRLTTINDYNQDVNLTQSATVGSVTVSTSIRTYRAGGSGHGRQGLGASDIAVGEFTITVDTPVNMAMAAAVPGDAGLQAPVGSTLTVSKIASTDAQNLYSGTMPTFTFPGGSGVGVGQTWQNLTSSRVTNTAYRNTSTAPIFVVVAASGYARGALQVSIDNVNWITVGIASDFASSASSANAVIPANSYYRFTAAFNVWSELK